jgi:hypothetical protein
LPFPGAFALLFIVPEGGNEAAKNFRGSLEHRLELRLLDPPDIGSQTIDDWPAGCARARVDVTRRPRCASPGVFPGSWHRSPSSGSLFLFSLGLGSTTATASEAGKVSSSRFQRLLETVALDVLVLVTLGSLSDASCCCFCHFNARSARLAGPRV